MARRSKVRIDRVIILILVALLVGGAIGFGIYKLISSFSSNTTTKKETQVVTTSDGVRLSLNDYTIYFDDTNDLGFSFIVADINFSSNEAFSFDFGKLQTSEKLYLNDVDKYVNKLDTAGYKLSDLDINTTGIVSETNSVDAKILIPYSTDSTSLTIYNLSNTSNSINIDLTKKKISATSLKLPVDDNEVVVGDTTVYISNAYISTFMLHNGNPYEIPTTSRIYSFEITIQQSKDNVKIVDAMFITNDGTKEYCKSSDYEAIDMNNILNKELSAGMTGGLFFEVHSTKDTVEDGSLLIKFSNSDTWVEVSNES